MIKDVLFSMQAFWPNHFMLPTIMHDHIQSMLTKFLWEGDINDKGLQRSDGTLFVSFGQKGVLGFKIPLIRIDVKSLLIFSKLSLAPYLWEIWNNTSKENISVC